MRFIAPSHDCNLNPHIFKPCVTFQKINILFDIAVCTFCGSLNIISIGDKTILDWLIEDIEAEEFIVYWLPLMEHNAFNLIAFQDDAYTDTAKLTITPAPDTECRIFMAYIPLEEAVEIAPQELPTFERSGFTVVEWGGVKIGS